MSWFDIIKISEDELDSVKPWIRDELSEGHKDRMAAYARIHRKLGRAPTSEELNEELKLKPHRRKPGTTVHSKDPGAYNRAYGRLKHRLGRNPTQDELVAEISNPTYSGYHHTNDTTRTSRKEHKEKLKEEYPIPERRMADLKGDLIVNTLEVFMSEFFDIDLLEIAGKTTDNDNRRFIHLQKYLDNFTDNEFKILSNMENDIPAMAETLLELLDSFNPNKNKNEYTRRRKKGLPHIPGLLSSKKKKKKRGPKPKKPDPLSERRDIV